MKKNNDVTEIAVTLTIIVILITVVSVSTFAYYVFSASNNTIIGGNSATTNLSLTVSKVKPNTETTDTLIITTYDYLKENKATIMGNNCMNSAGTYALCQVYLVTLTNNSSVTLVTNGSISFNNSTAPNLSWIKLANASDDFPNTFNTSSSSFTNFDTNITLAPNASYTAYIALWLEDIEELQDDNTSYSGTVRFIDSTGKGITSTFTS